MLVIILTMCNVATVYAAPSAGVTSSLGGTWTMYNMHAPNGGVEGFTTKVVYMPQSQVQALNDYYLSSSAVKDYLIALGLTKLTETAAKQILIKYGTNLVPLVGWTIIGIELFGAARDQMLRNSFLNAKNSSVSGTIKYVENYVAGVGTFAKYEVWGGSFMPLCIDIPYCDGYVIGNIRIGVYEY